jgi:hypothetical protein
MADESNNSLSNIPPEAFLSGLNFTRPGGGFSGQSQAGSLSGTQAGVQPGIQGGLDLQQLSELLQLQNAQQPGGANTSSLLAAIGGQGLGANSFGQTGGQSQIAGQTANAPAGMIAGSGGGTSVDPAALLAKFLGAAKTGVGLASNVNQDTAAQPNSQQQQTGTASPVVSDLSAGQPILTADQTSNLTQGTPADFAAFGGTGQEQAQVWQQLKSAGLSDADLQALGITGPEMGGANLAGPGAAAGTGFSQAGGAGGLSGSLGTPSPTTNVGGAIQGGLGAGSGLLNLISALQSGSVPGGIGGGLQTIGGLTQLLKAFPELAGLGGGALSNIGGAAGGLGGLLSIAQGIQGLTNGTGSVGSEISQLGGGALSAYGGLAPIANSLLGTALPSLGEAGMSALSAVAPEFAAQLSAQMAAQAAETAASGAAAGGSALVAAPLAAIALAAEIGGMLDSSKAAYGAQENFRKLTGELPEQIQNLRGLPAAMRLMPSDGTATPEQALAEIQAVNKIIDPWLNSGLYDFTQSGQTRAGGGSLGQDAVINFPQGPDIFNRIFSPAFNAAEQSLIPAYDVLGRSGQSATSQIPGFDPSSIVGLNFSPYNLGLQEIQRLNPNYQLVPSPEAISAAGPTPWQTPPPGFSFYGGRYVPTDVMGDLLGLQANGGLMSGIQNIVAKEQAGGYAPLASPGNLAVANAASQYNPMLSPTAEQLAAQYATPYQDLSGPQGGG